jgi:hypothetical protein
MKIQLKRSNVLDGGVAKEPTAAQMEYGELAVNYNAADPVLFLKDSANGIIRVSNLGPEANDGAININAGNGLLATGDNATANQVADTTRVLTVVAETGYGLDVASGIRIGGPWTNIPALPA